MQTIHNGDATFWTIPQTLTDMTGNLTSGQLPSAGIPIANISATGTPSSGNYLCGNGTWSPAGGGGSMTWPAAPGIAVYAGSNAWGTSLTAPASAIVGLTDSQTLTNKTLTSPALTTPALDTPTSGVLTNCTGLPAASVIAGTLASGMTLVAPVLGTPASGTLTNCTFPTLNQNTSGTAANLSGTPTLPSGTTLVAPVLGTPASGTLTNCTFPTLNQNTSGTSAGLTGTPNISVGSLTYTSMVTTVPAINDLNGIHNFSTSSLTPGGSAGVFNYITSSKLTMPAAYKTGIAAGTTLRWQIKMSKTAAGTGAFNIGIYMGTNGSISDTKEVTQSIGTATAALDDLSLDILVSFTSSTAFYWSISCLHSAATATGFGCATGSMSTSGTVTGLTTTTGSLIFGIAYSNTTGTAVITVPLVVAEAFTVN